MGTTMSYFFDRHYIKLFFLEDSQNFPQKCILYVFYLIDFKIEPSFSSTFFFVKICELRYQSLPQFSEIESIKLKNKISTNK